MVYEASREVKIPVIGIGGIATAEDALEFLIAERAPCRWDGQLLQPRRLPTDCPGIRGVLRSQGIKDINNLVGSLQV